MSVEILDETVDGRMEFDDKIENVEHELNLSALHVRLELADFSYDCISAEILATPNNDNCLSGPHTIA